MDPNRVRAAAADAAARRRAAPGSGPPGRSGVRPAGRPDLTVVAVSSEEVRVHTRLRLKVGGAVSYPVQTPGGLRTLTGKIQRCSVWRIDPDGLVFEVAVALDHPLSASDAEALAARTDQAAQRAAPVPDDPSILAFASSDIDEGPDLDSLLGETEE